MPRHNDSLTKITDNKALNFGATTAALMLSHILSSPGGFLIHDVNHQAGSQGGRVQCLDTAKCQCHRRPQK